MFKPKTKSGKTVFNIKLISDSGEYKVTGLTGRATDNISLFIDNASAIVPAQCAPLSQIPTALLRNLKDANLYKVVLNDVNLADANLSSANLIGASLGKVT